MSTALTMVAAFVLLAIPGPSQGAEPIRFASQVGYASVQVSGSFGFYLECRAGPEGIENFMTAHGLEVGLGSMGASVSVHRYHSGGGKLLQVGDDKVFVEEERVENPPFHRITGWASSGGIGISSGTRTWHIALAVWEGTVDCVLFMDGQSEPEPLTWLDGKYAMYVGPEGFTGGAFYQDGPTQISVGRIFERALPGGPVLGALLAAWPTHPVGRMPFHGESFVITDNPYVLGPGDFCQTFCSFSRPSASRLLAQVTAADEGGGWHSQLFLIAVPPNL